VKAVLITNPRNREPFHPDFNFACKALSYRLSNGKLGALCGPAFMQKYTEASPYLPAFGL
jgi:hypothetical protein